MTTLQKIKIIRREQQRINDLVAAQKQRIIDMSNEYDQQNADCADGLIIAIQFNITTMKNLAERSMKEIEDLKKLVTLKRRSQ